MSGKTRKSFLDSFGSAAAEDERRRKKEDKGKAHQAAVIRKLEDEIRELIKIIVNNFFCFSPRNSKILR